MHSVQAEVLLVGAGAAALPLLLIVIQVEAVVFNQADAEQTQIRPELVHQLVLAAVCGGSGGEVELPAENRREDIELLMVEAERGRRQGRAAAAAAAAADGGTADGTDATRTGCPGTSGQIVSQGDAGVTWSRSLVLETPNALGRLCLLRRHLPARVFSEGAPRPLGGYARWLSSSSSFSFSASSASAGST